MANSPDRSKYVRLLLYPDCLDHVPLLVRMMKPDFEYDYVAVLHDRDVLEDGSPSKPHYHVVMAYKYQKYYSAWRKDLGLTEQFCKECDKRDDAIRYLFHFGWPDKVQYELDEGFGSLLPLAEKLCQEKLSESQQVMMLIEILDKLPRGSGYRKFLEAACKADLYSAFRRLGIGVVKLLEEKHDFEYSHPHLP